MNKRDVRDDRKVIAWDVDDVLNDLLVSFLKNMQSTGAMRHVVYKDLINNPPHAAFNMPLEQYLHNLDQFRLRHYADLIPSAAVLQWFKTHGDRFLHVAVSSAPRNYATHSAAWVMRWYGDWIRSYNFVPSPRDADTTTIKKAGYPTKADFLCSFKKIDLFIDDNSINVEAVAKLGIPTILWPQPWNNSTQSAEEALNAIESAL